MLQMLNNKILVEPVKGAESKNGIYYTEEQRSLSHSAKVLSVNKDAPVKEGDTVIYGEYAGEQVTIDKKKYLMLTNEDCWARRDNAEM